MIENLFRFFQNRKCKKNGTQDEEDGKYPNESVMVFQENELLNRSAEPEQ